MTVTLHRYQTQVRASAGWDSRSSQCCSVLSWRQECRIRKEKTGGGCNVPFTLIIKMTSILEMFLLLPSPLEIRRTVNYMIHFACPWVSGSVPTAVLELPFTWYKSVLCTTRRAGAPGLEFLLLNWLASLVSREASMGLPLRVVNLQLGAGRLQMYVLVLLACLGPTFIFQPGATREAEMNCNFKERLRMQTLPGGLGWW